MIKKRSTFDIIKLKLRYLKDKTVSLKPVKRKQNANIFPQWNHKGQPRVVIQPEPEPEIVVSRQFEYLNAYAELSGSCIGDELESLGNKSYNYQKNHVEELVFP